MDKLDRLIIENIATVTANLEVSRALVGQIERLIEYANICSTVGDKDIRPALEQVLSALSDVKHDIVIILNEVQK
jgi:hypothetical protein